MLAPSARRHASPAQGLLLCTSPILPALWELGNMTDSCATARLVRALWHRHEHQEPLKHTRNKSLPGAHLAFSTRLQGHLFGLALSASTSAQIEAVLRMHGVAELARETKVSIARFVRLCTLVRDGLSAESALTSGATSQWAAAPSSVLLPAGLSSAAVMLAFMWSTAASKACVLAFYEAAAVHLPAGALLGGEYEPNCERWRREWLASAYAQHSAADGSAAALAAANGLASSWPPTAEAIELLAFGLGSRGSERPEVPQSRHGHQGQPEVADCLEAIARDALSLALWDGQRGRFEPSRLPPAADKALRAFFDGAPEARSEHRSSQTWFELCAARPGLAYLSGRGVADAEFYELSPSLANFRALLDCLVGVALAPPAEAEAAEEERGLTPLWEGCPLAWGVRGAESDRPVLWLRPLREPTTGGTPKGASEELRLIFKSGVHCYALRRVTSEEPRWIDGVRRVWLQRWREHGAAAEEGLGGAAIAGSALLRSSMLLAHRCDAREDAAAAGAVGRDEASACASAALACLSAAPFGFEERARGLHMLLRAGPLALDLLPLLLQPPAATVSWDDLTLGTCVETLQPAMSDRAGGTEAVRKCMMAAAAQPPLHALLSLQATDGGEQFRAAFDRCSAEERSQVLRIALGHSGPGSLSLGQRAAAAAAICRSWLSL